jgi:SMC interacting uncharacterized protein involved in chromosome segregation
MARISSMNEGMENIKTIESLEEENLKLKKEIDRLNEYVQNLEIIEGQHKEMNGKMHAELAKLKIANKKLEKKVMEFVRPTKRRID